MKSSLCALLLFRLLICNASEEKFHTNVPDASTRMKNIQDELSDCLKPDKLVTHRTLDPQTTDEEFSNILPWLKMIPYLSSLDLKNTQIADKTLELIAKHLPHLILLDLSNTKITCRGLGDLSRIPNLIGVNLERCSYINNENIYSLQKLCPQLSLLAQEVTHMIQLREVVKNHYKQEFLTFKSALTDYSLKAVMPILKTIPDLKTIEIKNSQITDESLYLISRSLPKLKGLNLENCPQLSLQMIQFCEKRFDTFKINPSIRMAVLKEIIQKNRDTYVLDFSNMNITDEELKSLIEDIKLMKNLTSINLLNNMITKASLTLIKEKLIDKITSLTLKENTYLSQDDIEHFLSVSNMDIWTE